MPGSLLFFLCHWCWIDSWVHSHQVLGQSFSWLTHAIDSFLRAKPLYNGTIKNFSTLVQPSMASNEMFNYKQALQEPDYHEFIKAMVNKIDDHESQVYWTLAIHCDNPPGTKTIIMSIWSFKRKQNPDGTLNNTKHVYVHMVACKHGEGITGKRMHQLLTGQAFASCLRWQRFMVCLQRV